MFDVTYAPIDATESTDVTDLLPTGAGRTVIAGEEQTARVQARDRFQNPVLAPAADHKPNLVSTIHVTLRDQFATVQTPDSSFEKKY